MAKMKLGTLEEEATACRKAWKGKSRWTWAWHCHHEILFEQLYKSAGKRITYITDYKPEEEKALRLRLFRPIKNQRSIAKIDRDRDKACDKAYRAYDRNYKSLGWRKAEAVLTKDLDAAENNRTKAIATLHSKQCPKCPWDGTTIFPEPKKRKKA